MITKPLIGLHGTFAGGGYDVDAQSYIDALHSHIPDLGGIYGSLTDVQVANAINQFFLDCKGIGTTTNNSNFYSSLHAMYPIIGATADTHKYNAINPVDSDGAFRITWNGTVNHDNIGASSDGTTGYGNTHYIPSSEMTLNDNHISFYANGTLGTGTAPLGAESSASNWLELGMSTSLVIFRNYDNSTSRILYSYGSNVPGFSLGNRVNANSSRLKVNDTLGGTISISVGGLPTIPFFVLARSQTGLTPSAITSNTFDCLFWSFGSSLTTNQETDLYDAVQKLQTTLGRNV